MFGKAAIEEGVTKIRLSGGEPLLRSDLDTLIRMIHDYAPQIDLALTTNGFLLADVAGMLADAGLKRINVSLDSLKPAVAAQIAQKNVLGRVLEGIDAAQASGLKIKINMVPLKGINDNEITDVLEYAKARGIEIRFIEYMENALANDGLKGMLGKEILDKIKEKYVIKKIGRQGSSPSFAYELEDGYRFGLIDPHKHDFCETCNRIRLTAEGYLIPCLYFDEAMSIKDAVESGDIDGAVKTLRTVLADKPKENRWSDEESETSNRAFYETGG